jgi:shikimate kinase
VFFPKKDTLYLIGFMGSGKSTLGKKIAHALHYDFVDLDRAIENESGKRINAIFSEDGEARFREMESALLKKLSEKKFLVVATGGGTPCFHNNMQWMHDHGCCVYIKMPPLALYSRLEQAAPKRPLLEGKTGDELKQFITDTLAQRESFYQQSHLVIDGISVGLPSLMSVLKPKMALKPHSV